MNVRNGKIEIDYDKEQKIQWKLYSIALTKIAMGLKPFITTPEFKHIITRYHIRGNEWFKFARSLENKKCLELRGSRGVYIRLNFQSIVGLYKNNYNLDLNNRALHLKLKK